LYGKKDIICGFRFGSENVAKREDVRKKISVGVKKFYKFFRRKPWSSSPWSLTSKIQLLLQSVRNQILIITNSDKNKSYEEYVRY